MATQAMLPQILHWWDFPQWNLAEEPAEKPLPLSFRIARTYDPTLVYNPEDDTPEDDVDLMAQLNMLRERKAQKTKERILQERAEMEKDKLARAEAKIRMLQDQREETVKPSGNLVVPEEPAPEEPKKKKKRSMLGKKKKSSEEKRAAKKLQHQQKKEFLLRTQSMSSIDPSKKIDFRAEAAAARAQQQPWSAAPAKPPKRVQRNVSVGSTGSLVGSPATVAKEASPVEVEQKSASQESVSEEPSLVNVPAPSGASTSSPSVAARRAPPKRDSIGTMTATIQLKSKLERLSGMLTEIEDLTTAGECSQWETAKSLVAEMLADIASTTAADVPVRRAVPQRRTLVNSPNRRSLQVPRKSSSGSQNQPSSGLFAQAETAAIPSAEAAVRMRSMSPRAPDETAPGAPPEPPAPGPAPVRSPRSTPPAVSPRRGQTLSPRGAPPVVSPRRNPPSMVQAPDGSLVQAGLPSPAGRGRGRGMPPGGAVRGRAVSGGRSRGINRRLSSPNFGRKIVQAPDGSPLLAPAEEAALPPVEKIDQEMQDLIDDLLLTR